MRRFIVPQFIDVEDKIFGPLTLKQFIYLLGGGAGAFILYVFLPFFLAILIGLPIIGFALALAFFKINNQPFIKIVASALSYYSTSRLYIWRKGERKKRGLEALRPSTKAQLEIPKVTGSKLKDLAWSLDVKEKVK